MSDCSKQKVYLTDINREPNTGGRKQARIELRLLKEACSLKIEPDVLPKEENVAPDTNLFRVTAYCTADNYDLKNLYKYLKKNSLCSKVSMYFGECLYTRMSFGGEGDEGQDCFFYEYGVVVCWGMDANQESMIVKLVSKHEENPYEASDIEVESFKYGITENPFIINDIIYLNSENHFSKMVVSIAIAQSVKLDYFENLVDNTIEAVKEFPEDMEREGKVSRNRREILKMIGKLHRLRFNLNLGSNILDEPEFVWDYPAFSPLYETCKRYLDIKHRADLLNRRCDVINGILEILSENTNRSNVEKFEVVLIVIVLSNVLLIALLMVLMYYIRLKW